MADVEKLRRALGKELKEMTELNSKLNGVCFGLRYPEADDATTFVRATPDDVKARFKLKFKAKAVKVREAFSALLAHEWWN